MQLTHKGSITLSTDRLILRKVKKADAKDMFFGWANDPDVTKFLLWQTHKNLRTTKRVIRRWRINARFRKNFYHWIIVLKESGKPIGSMGLVQCLNEKTLACEIGYCISKSYWGQGITAEALKRLIEFLFNEVGFNRVAARHDPKNPNSGKVMQKAGMFYEGTLRQADTNNTGVCDVSYYSVLKEEFDNSIY